MTPRVGEGLIPGGQPAITGDVATVRALLDVGAGLAPVKKAEAQGGIPFVLVPQGYSIEQAPVAQHAIGPGKAVTLHDPASFARYFTDHATPASRVYADEAARSFIAVLDDYGPLDKAGEGFAFRSMRANYVAEFSPEWLAWAKSDGVGMDQEDFAEFLEDQIPDIVTPTGADLIEIALNFEVSSSGFFQKPIRQADGSFSLVYRNDQQQTGQFVLPPSLWLSIPVFKHGPAVSLEAKLRYRLAGEKLTLSYHLVRPARAVEKAYADLVGTVASGCTIQGQASPILLGVCP